MRSRHSGCWTSWTANSNPPIDQRTGPPQIFVNGAVYHGTGYTVSEIPDDAGYIGSIAEAVPQNEPMVHENFYSNALPAETELYSSALDQSVVYAKVETPSGISYAKYGRSEPAGTL